jgi:hypothetical protein
MDPTTAPVEHNNAGATPPRVIQRSNLFAGRFTRTSESFTAEYVVFLVALGVVLSNLAWLVYVFFGLIVDAMHGGGVSSYVAANMFVLWLAVSSAITLPVTVALWSRVQGELAANPDYKGELPKGAARGFRTFWITLSALGMIGMLLAAMYAPLAALVGGVGGVEALLAVTLPSLINIVILTTGLYIVTRRVDQRSKVSLLLWIVAALTVVLFATDFLWASNAKKADAPSQTTYPSTYDDTYYDYSSPYSNPSY